MSSTPKQGLALPRSRLAIAQRLLLVGVVLFTLIIAYLMGRDAVRLNQALGPDALAQFSASRAMARLQRELLQTQVSVKEYRIPPEVSGFHDTGLATAAVLRSYSFIIAANEALLAERDALDKGILQDPNAAATFERLQEQLASLNHVLGRFQSDDLTQPQRRAILRTLDTDLVVAEVLVRDLVELQQQAEIDDLNEARQIANASRATLAVGGAALLLMTASLLLVTRQALNRRLRQAYERLQEDAAQLQLAHDKLEAAYQEVARLGNESERRAGQLEAAATVGRAASSLLALDRLLESAVSEICRAFGYYHTQVFLIEAEQPFLTLRAAMGDEGQSCLMGQTPKLPIGGHSLIGQTSARGEPMLARDTEHDPYYQPSELLPDTRAELAIPLKIGATTLGVLDIQSRAKDAFTPADITVLQIMADQIAIAIQNAAAYESQKLVMEQLQEVDKLKSQFLANMSHELRTPLNSIIGFSRVILKGIDGPTTDLQQHDLTTIHSSAQHLLHLIDGILDISKIEAGKMEMHFDDADFIREVVDPVISTAQGLVKDKPVTLVKQVPASLPTLYVDAIRLRQVLLNLLSNAAKFTEQGEIRLSVAVVAESLVVSVSDTGLGILPENQQRLFSHFYQVDGSTTRKVSGTGLGLVISKSFVEMHGGTIWVESSGVEGEGTTFTFTLPLAGPPEPAPEKLQEPAL